MAIEVVVLPIQSSTNFISKIENSLSDSCKQKYKNQEAQARVPETVIIVDEDMLRVNALIMESRVIIVASKDTSLSYAEGHIM